LDNKRFNKLTIYLAISALAISIASFIISLKSCNISSDDLDLKIEPRIKAQFQNLDSNNISLVIYNEGARNIKDIRVTKIKRLFFMGDNIDVERLGSTQRIAELDVEDSIEVNLSYEDKMQMISKTKEKIPNIDQYSQFYIGFLIQYKCKPDNSEYKFSKYILLWQTEYGNFIPIDLDQPGFYKYNSENPKIDFEKTDYYYTN